MKMLLWIFAAAKADSSTEQSYPLNCSRASLLTTELSVGYARFSESEEQYLSIAY